MDKPAVLLRDYKKRFKQCVTNEEKQALKDEIRKKPEARIALTSVLNFFEHMCQEIENGIADEEYLKDFFHLIVIDYYHTYLWYINDARENQKSSDTFRHFENVVIKWSSNGNT